jgi:preprotein translocase subunit YajC
MPFDIITQFGVVIAVGIAFYWFLIRPQIARMDRHRVLISSVGIGDRVVFAGGLVGVITSLQSDDIVLITVGDGLQLSCLRDSIERRLLG